MSYEKHTWQTGETITAEKLNNLENGIEDAGSSGSGSGILIANCIEDDPEDYVEPRDPNNTVSGQWHLDKTVGELLDAFEDNIPIYLKWNTTEADFVGVEFKPLFSFGIVNVSEHDRYYFYDGTYEFMALDNLNSYPIYTAEEISGR